MVNEADISAKNEGVGKETKERIVIFLIITFAVAWSLFLMIPLSGTVYGSSASAVFLVFAMMAPTIGNLATRVITGEGWKNMYLNPNFKGHGRAYAIVFFAPTVLILLSMGFYFILFQKQFDSELTTFSAVLAQSGQTTGITPQLMLIISLAQMALIGPIINLVPTMGEELGWRGYLLPKLRTLYPDRKAFLISGVIWGVWHAPIIAMGHNYGTAYFGYPWLGILMMIVFCMALGTIEGYASIRMNSAIPAGMIHSAVNAGAALPIYLIQGPYNPIIGPAITGLVGGLPVFLLAAFFWWHSKSKRQPDLGMTDSSVPIA